MSPYKKLLSAALLLPLLFGAVGCGSNIGLDRSAKAAVPLTHTEEKDGAKFAVNISRTHVEAGQEIVVQAEITNVGTEPIPYQGMNSCDDGVRIRVPVPAYEDEFAVEQNNKDSERICAEVISEKKLEPGASLKKEVTLHPTTTDRSGRLPVPPGEYQLHVGLSKSFEEQLEVTVPLQVTGKATGQITKQEAVRIAGEDPEVQSWLALHSGDNIAKIENGRYYIREFGGAWQEVSEPQYRLAHAFPDENRQVLFTDDGWVVRYGTRLGDAPHGIEVVIDSKKGTVKSVNTHEK